jgi:hypothetical protein
MSRSIAVTPHPDHPNGGYALVRVTPVTIEPADRRIQIHRGDWERPYLGDKGWQVGEAYLQPETTNLSDGAWVLTLGPSIVQEIDAGTFRVSFPGLSLVQNVLWPNIDPLPGGKSHGHSIATTARVPGKPITSTPKFTSAQPQTSAPVLSSGPVEAPRSTAMSGAAPASPLPASRRRRQLTAGALALMVLAGGGFYWYSRSPASVPVGVAAVDIPPATADFDVDRAPVREIIERASTGPDGNNFLIDVAVRRVGQNNHDDALVLYEVAADRGSSVAMTRIAKMYDPNGFRPGAPFNSPDPRQAAKYYKMAIEAGDTTATEPRAALKRSLEERIERGDVAARTILSDYWPP